MAISGRENNIYDEDSASEGGAPIKPLLTSRPLLVDSSTRLSLTGKRSTSAVPQRVSLGGAGGAGSQFSSTASPASFGNRGRFTDDCGATHAFGGAATESSCFSPEAFCSLLRDGLPHTAVHISNERELSKHVAKVSLGLGNAEEWNARISALQLLQNLAMGNLADFECCGSVVRSLVEPVS